MARTPAKHNSPSDDARAYAPAWARERTLPVAPASAPPPADWSERSSPSRLSMGIGGPNIDPSRLRPQYEGDTAVSWSHEPNVPERLLRIRSQQTRRRVARLSLLLMVSGFAAFGLTAVMSSDRTAQVSPPDEPSTYGLASAPTAPNAAAGPRSAVLQVPTVSYAAAGPDRWTILPAPTAPDAATGPDRQTVLPAPTAPDAATGPDQRTALQAPAVPDAVAGHDQRTVLQAPAIRDAAVGPDRRAILHAPNAPDAAAGPDQRTVLQAPAMKLKLPPDEIVMLLRRGRDMLKVGDILAARLLLRRAAEAGNSEAAFKLASTFDPIVVRDVGIIGVAPDVTQALSWYETASALGSEEARHSIERLGQAENR